MLCIGTTVLLLNSRIDRRRISLRHVEYAGNEPITRLVLLARDVALDGWGGYNEVDIAEWQTDDITSQKCYPRLHFQEQTK